MSTLTIGLEPQEAVLLYKKMESILDISACCSYTKNAKQTFHRKEVRYEKQIRRAAKGAWH